MVTFICKCGNCTGQQSRLAGKMCSAEALEVVRPECFAAECQQKEALFSALTDVAQTACCSDCWTCCLLWLPPSQQRLPAAHHLWGLLTTARKGCSSSACRVCRLVTRTIVLEAERPEQQIDLPADSIDIANRQKKGSNMAIGIRMPPFRCQTAHLSVSLQHRE